MGGDMIMGSRRNAVIVVVWVMLSVFVSAGRMGREGLFLGWRDSSRGSMIIDQGMVEQMWINCSLHLMNFDDFSLLKYIASDSHETKRRARLILEGSTEEAMILMSPEIKMKFMNCLSKQNFDVTEEDGTRNILTEFLNSLLGSNLASRRHLAYIPIRMMAPASAPSIAAAPSFALSLSLALAPTPSPGIDPPSSSPAPSLVPAPASTPALTSAPTPSDIILAPPPESKDLTGLPDSSPDSYSVLPTKNQPSNARQIIIAVVATATVVSLISGLLAFLCLRRTKTKCTLGHGLKDDHFVVLNDLYGSSVEPNKNAFGASTFKGSKRHDMKSTEEPSNGFSGGTKCSIDQEGGDNSDSKLPLLPGHNAARPCPVPPPPPPNFKRSPQPPPPPKCASPPRPPPSGARVYRPSPLGPKKSGDPVPNVEAGTGTDANAPKTKLKPFFWDKVQANTDQSMVWDQLKEGSFQFNEEKIESLFGYNIIEQQKSVGKKESSSKEPAIQYIQLLEPKKAQNLAISLKAMNVKTEEICDALKEGTELPTDLLQTLMRMVPSTDEELKLRLYSGDLSLLGPAEQFLKTMVDIPFAFQRMDALLFKSSLQEDVSCTKEAYSTLEAACKEVRSSRIFLKLLEAVLKTGNRMNDGTFRGDAQAFKLDTLLKLSDVKGIDGKTTLLHFVVQEIIRSEGVRAARTQARESRSITSLNDDDFVDNSASDSGEYLHTLGLNVVSGVCNELRNVKKAAGLDFDALTSTVANLGQRLVKMNEFMNTNMQSIEEENRFQQSLAAFLEQAQTDITLLLEEEKRIRALVRSTTDYFHGSAAKDEGLRLFVIVRDFLGMIDKVCKEIAESSKRAAKTPRSRDTPNMSPARDAPNMSPLRDPRLLLFPAIRDQRIDCSSSDDDD